jgi:hypothetical protein
MNARSSEGKGLPGSIGSCFVCPAIVNRGLEKPGAEQGPGGIHGEWAWLAEVAGLNASDPSTLLSAGVFAIR